MKKLDRTQVTEPICLSNLKNRQNNGDFQDLNSRDKWKKLQGVQEKKKAVWKALNELQHNCCAYCECQISPSNHHIEHFYPRATYDALIFDWDNLFGSCNGSSNSGHCGHFKDNQEPIEVLKPDEDNGADFFSFDVTGKIFPANSLDHQDSAKAKKTIDLFNLDCGFLQNSRDRTYKNLTQTMTSVIKALKRPLTRDERRKILTKHYHEQENKEFSTFIRFLIAKQLKNLESTL